MQTLSRVVAISALLLAPLLKADTIVMKNGDRVSGSIVKQDGKSVTIKTTHFGTVTAPWDQVASITAESPLTVVLADGKTVEGTVSTSEQKVQVSSKTGTEAAALSDVAAMRNADEQRTYQRLLRPHLLDLWTITGTLGIAATAGNSRTSTFTLPVTAVRATNHDKTTTYFNFVRSSALVNGVSSDTAEAVRGGWAYNRNLHPRVFVNIFNDFEYDRFQNLDLRVVLGTGLGYSALKRERARLDVVAGGDWNREAFSPPAPDASFSRHSAEAYWGDDFSLKLNSRAAMTQSYRLFNNLSRGGDYRQNFDFGLTTKLTKWLTWNASASDRYLSTPVSGRKKNDVLISTGFGFTFVR